MAFEHVKCTVCNGEGYLDPPRNLKMCSNCLGFGMVYENTEEYDNGESQSDNEPPPPENEDNY